MDSFLGEIRMFAGNFAPSSWRLCDGSMLDVAVFRDLFKLIGTRWGGNGVTTFALPDLRGRVAVGSGSSPGLSPRDVGGSGGAESVALKLQEMPMHTHNFIVSTSAATAADVLEGIGLAKPAYTNGGPLTPSGYIDPKTPGTKTYVLGTRTVQKTGSGAPHDNMMPSSAVNFVICVNGRYPEMQ